jgi:two-component system, cell cycle sensor histidine kinase and response regulator CckA
MAEVASIIPDLTKIIPGSGRVLVIDDEELVRDTISAILKALGYAAICVKDGQEGLIFLDRQRACGCNFDAVICDLTLPGGMGGIEIVSIIRQTDEVVPVVVSSGYSEDPVMAYPQKYGFSASIAKPFTVTELQKLLNSVLKKQ